MANTKAPTTTDSPYVETNLVEGKNNVYVSQWPTDYQHRDGRGMERQVDGCVDGAWME